MAETQLLRAALWYARHGWPVFPCVSGAKEPLTDNGYKDASRDAATIRAWWARWPGANVAIATGAADLLVVDADVKKGKPGLESWRDLRADLHLDDNTVTCETPSGGLHIYYSANGHTVRCSQDTLGDGLDVRAQGGYVVAPPSTTEAGDYGWALGCRPNERALLPMPTALAERLAEPKEREPRPIPERNLRDLGAEVARAAAALARLDPGRADGYQTWIEVGMSLCELGDAGLALWDRWSAQSAKHSAGACAEKWATFAPGDGMTLASLYHWAKEDAGIGNGNVDSRNVRSGGDVHNTDLGNARRLVALHGADLRYCYPWARYLVWDGMRWADDLTGEVWRRAKDVPRALYLEAGKAADDDERKAAGKWALHSEATTRLYAAVTLAQSEPGIPIVPDHLDGEP